MEGGDSKGDDRMSVLPEPIVHHILSFLLVKDAIQISPTCKRLNHVWNTVPHLDLGRDFFPAPPPPKRAATIIDDANDEGNGRKIIDEENNDTKRREALFTFVEQTLARRSMQDLTIRKFHIFWDKSDVELEQNLDRWIGCLVQHCNINELYLEARPCGGVGYNLPPILLTAKSLRTLRLRFCSMPSGAIAGLSSLLKLDLTYGSLPENFIIDIINTCRDLKDLNVNTCIGLPKRILVPGRPQLKALGLILDHTDDVCEVVLEAHHLEKLTYGRGTRPVIITDFELNLKELHLSYVDNITNMWLCELISRLSHLEVLILRHLDLKAIEISSSSIKRLILGVFSKKIMSGVFTIDTPNLVHLSYFGTVSSVFNNSLAVKNVSLEFCDLKGPINDEQYWGKLMQFLQKFDYSEVVTLQCDSFKLMIFPAEMRLNLHPPLAHVKHFILQGTFSKSVIDVLKEQELFKCLQWIAPNLDSLSLKRTSTYADRLYVDLIKFTAGQCKCSMRCLSLTKFELRGVDTEVDALRNYLKHDSDGLRCNQWNMEDLPYGMS